MVKNVKFYAKFKELLLIYIYIYIFTSNKKLSHQFLTVLSPDTFKTIWSLKYSSMPDIFFVLTVIRIKDMFQMNSIFQDACYCLLYMFIPTISLSFVSKISYIIICYCIFYSELFKTKSLLIKILALFIV